MIKISIFCISIFLFSSCTEPTKPKVVGYYSIDKYSVRDTFRTIISLSYLTLKDDETFVLSNLNKKGSIIGKWKILKSNGEDEGVIQFEFEHKIIQASLRQSILSFTYPNDFNDGYYDNILYVKLNTPPSELLHENK